MTGFIDGIFDAAITVFGLVGFTLIVAGVALAILLTRFLKRSKPVVAQVVAHTGQRLKRDERTGIERAYYHPVFGVMEGVHAGVRYTSSEWLYRNIYPIGTKWPAEFDPKSGVVRTGRTLSLWPWFSAMLIVLGIGFVCIPQLPLFDGDVVVGPIFMFLGLGVFAGGLGKRWFEAANSNRVVRVTAKLIAIDVDYDIDQYERDVPVLRITSGDYADTECTDIEMANVVSQSDIGQQMIGVFDPYTCRLKITEGKFATKGTAVPLMTTGLTFSVIGVAIYLFA